MIIIYLLNIQGELVSEPDFIDLIRGSDVLVPLAFELPEVLLTATPTELQSGNLGQVDLDIATRADTPSVTYIMDQ